MIITKKVLVSEGLGFAAIYSNRIVTSDTLIEQSDKALSNHRKVYDPW